MSLAWNHVHAVGRRICPAILGKLALQLVVSYAVVSVSHDHADASVVVVRQQSVVVAAVGTARQREARQDNDGANLYTR